MPSSDPGVAEIISDIAWSEAPLRTDPVGNQAALRNMTPDGFVADLQQLGRLRDRQQWFQWSRRRLGRARHPPLLYGRITGDGAAVDWIGSAVSD